MLPVTCVESVHPRWRTCFAKSSGTSASTAGGTPDLRVTPVLLQPRPYRRVRHTAGPTDRSVTVLLRPAFANPPRMGESSSRPFAQSAGWDTDSQSTRFVLRTGTDSSSSRKPGSIGTIPEFVRSSASMESPPSDDRRLIRPHRSNMPLVVPAKVHHITDAKTRFPDQLQRELPGRRHIISHHLPVSRPAFAETHHSRSDDHASHRRHRASGCRARP